ncbi:MAG: hypothetical protein HY402_06280 [Elusimicrobia bacterium]|nr:hypothetical protein [Elusimicrobiota bacterium]
MALSDASALHASFLLDTFLLLPASGFLIAYLTRNRPDKAPALGGLTLLAFWAIAGGLYFDLWNFPFLSEAGQGNHFMWNSGIELLGLSPRWPAQPTYAAFWSPANLAALILFLVAYPSALALGYRWGNRKWHRV